MTVPLDLPAPKTLDERVATLEEREAALVTYLESLHNLVDATGVVMRVLYRKVTGEEFDPA